MATVRGIAKRAGTSPSTVSRVLRKEGYVSAEVRARVIAAARELDYVVELKDIAVIIPDTFSFGGYAGLMLSFFLKEATRRGFRMEVIPESSVTLLSNHLLAGAISLLYDNGFERVWNLTQNLPLVCVNTRSRHFEHIYSVRSDNFQGIRMALDHFLARGHTRIAFACYYQDCAVERDNTDRMERIQAYRMWMDKNAATDFKPLILYHPTELEQLYAEKATALLISGEGIGKFYLAPLFRKGIRIPDDLSLIVYESDDNGIICPPAVTSISQNFSEISKQALDLLELIIKGGSNAIDIEIPYLFFERGSVRDLALI